MTSDRRRLLMAIYSGGSGPLYDAEIEYLQSADGNQYIDCGFIADQAIDFELLVMRINNAIRWDCGSEEGWSSKIARLLVQENNMTRWRYHTGGADLTQSSNLIGDLTLTVNGREASVTNLYSGNTYSGTGPSGSFVTPGHFLLFAFTLGQAPSLAADSAGSRLKGAVITDGAASLDLIPVRKGTVGYMYDRNSNLLLPNAGTGAFLLGPDKVEEILPEGATAYDYIQSDGTQYIDTGVGNGVASTSLVVDTTAQFLNTTGRYSWAIHGKIINSAVWGLQNNSSNLEVQNPGGFVSVSGWGYSKVRSHFESRQWNTNGTLRSGGNAWTLTSNIFLFTSYLMSNNAYAKLWKTKIVVDNVIVRYFQPCTDANGRAALYDYVTKQYFYGDNGAGNDFTVGND